MRSLLAIVHVPDSLAVAGYLLGPTIGLALLIIGFALRSRDRNRPPAQPGAPAAPAAAAYPAMAPLPYPAIAPYPGVPLPGYGDHWPYSPPPRKRLRGTTAAAVGAVIFVGFTIGELGYAGLTGKPLHKPVAGDCFTRASLTQPGRPVPVDCDLPNTLVLADISTDNHCPDGPVRDSRYIATGSGDDRTWCLVPNFTQGQCFRVDSPETVYELTDCDGGHADIKVIRRLDNSGPSRCPAGSIPLYYPQPQRVYCLQVVRPRVFSI